MSEISNESVERWDETCIILVLPPEETRNETCIKHVSLNPETPTPATITCFNILRRPAPAPPLISYGIKALTGYRNPISETIVRSASQRAREP